MAQPFHDELLAKLNESKWPFADKDLVARTELASRIAAVGRKRHLITYSDLVHGVTFHLPNVNQGSPFQIDVMDWSDLDRAILGDFLGAISADSYREGEFLATALVVNKQEFVPSDQFFKWMEKLGVLPNRREGTVMSFWLDQVTRAHDWYAKSRDNLRNE